MATAQSIRDDLETVSLLILEIDHFAKLAYELAGDGMDQNMPKWPWLLQMKCERLTQAFDAVHTDVNKTALPLLQDMSELTKR